MKFEEKNPPRVFSVNEKVRISDCGKVFLDANEQVTFVTDSKKEYDFAAKDWGFYATPSVNGRLRDQGFKTALVRNTSGRYYIMVVDQDKIDAFQEYLKEDNQEIVEWIDERN